jgi:hypothetical protein
VSAQPRIALLWHQAEDETKARRARLDGVFQALSAHGAMPEPVVYSDQTADATHERLLRVDGVLVWVNPVTAGRDRTVLDALLGDVAASGVWISAHPDIVTTLGTKEVLYHTRTLGCGSDIRLYEDAATLSEALPARLAAGPTVIKRARGNGGLGVWKIELAVPSTPSTLATTVRVEHAHDGATELLSLGSFIESFAGYFDGGGRLIEQPFQPRVAEGMVRCYLSGRDVAGFAEHLPRGFLPASRSQDGSVSALDFEKVMYGPDAARFQGLRVALEREWIPGMQRLVGRETAVLPAIWDADFLRGPKTGADTWVLCEVNVSCVSPFPDVAAEAIARTTLDRVLAR